MKKNNTSPTELSPVMALEEFYATAELTDLWKLIQQDLDSPEAQEYFRRTEQTELEDEARLRYQTVGHEDLRVFVIP